MAKVMISACLLGCNVRYNGSDLPVNDPSFSRLISENQVIPFCPEIAAGLPTPRPAAEICSGDGQDVLCGNAKVICAKQQDFTQAFLKGASLALELCQKEEVGVAVLAEGSPSCGSGKIYDGSFSGALKPGQGVVAAALVKDSVKVFNQHQVLEAIHFLQKGRS